jgi:hypothetical protein
MRVWRSLGFIVLGFVLGVAAMCIFAVSARDSATSHATNHREV